MPNTILHVAIGGSDSNNGQTWDTAKATVANAVTTVLNGPGTGKINIGAGSFPVSNIAISKSLFIQGLGMGTTELTVPEASARGLWIQGRDPGGQGGRSTLRDFTIRGSTSAATTSTLISVDTADWTLIERVCFRDVGRDRTNDPGTTPANTPAALVGEDTDPLGSGDIAEWNTVRDCVFVDCFRGWLTGSWNGYLSGCTFLGGVREQAYCVRATKMRECTFIADSRQASGAYLIRLNVGYHSQQLNQNLTDVSAGNGHHILISSATQPEHTIITNHTYISHATNPSYVTYDNAQANRHGPYVSQGNTIIRQINGSSGNVLWQPSDFTGTF